jgi:ankyrin repeat protein
MLLANTYTLMKAASAGSIGLVEIIIQRGINVSAQADDGHTALHCAARANQIEMIHLLIALGAHSDVRNDKGRTPLHEAVSGRCIPAFNVLVGRTADITKHVLGETIETGQHELFQQAWESCHKEMLGTIGRSLFDVAADSTQTASMATLLLLPDITPEWILRAGIATIRRVVLKDRIAMLECLLESTKLEPIVNKPIGSWRSGSLIHFAAAHGRAEIVELLLTYRIVDPNLVPEYYGLSPMNIAASHGHFETVKRFLEHPGIILNSKTGLGSHTTNPLFLASGKGHVEIVRLMLKTFDERGLDVDNTSGSFYKRTPLQTAVFYGHTEVVKLLLLLQDIDVNKTVGNTRLSTCQVAAWRGHAQTLAVLLEHPRTDQSNVKNGRDSLLFKAAREAHWLLVEILLDYDEASPQDTQRKLYTRKDIAGNRIGILETLLADVAFRQHCTKDERANLWHVAAKNNNLELAMVLLEHAQRNEGFEHPALDVNNRNGMGDAPLLVALESARIGIVELLLHHKDIDINITSKGVTRESAVQRATRYTKYPWKTKEALRYIVDLLLAHGAQNASRKRTDDTNNLVLPPLLTRVGDSNNLIMPSLFECADAQDSHSARGEGDLRQSMHASWASIVGIQDNSVGSGEMDRNDNVLGDMTPKYPDDWLEEDPDVIYEELMHFHDEEMSESNNSWMLDQGTFCEPLIESAYLPAERTM